MDAEQEGKVKREEATSISEGKENGDNCQPGNSLSEEDDKGFNLSIEEEADDEGEIVDEDEKNGEMENKKKSPSPTDQSAMESEETHFDKKVSALEKLKNLKFGSGTNPFGASSSSSSTEYRRRRSPSKERKRTSDNRPVYERRSRSRSPSPQSSSSSRRNTSRFIPRRHDQLSSSSSRRSPSPRSAMPPSLNNTSTALAVPDMIAQRADALLGYSEEDVQRFPAHELRKLILAVLQLEADQQKLISSRNVLLDELRQIHVNEMAQVTGLRCQRNGVVGDFRYASSSSSSSSGMMGTMGSVTSHSHSMPPNMTMMAGGGGGVRQQYSMPPHSMSIPPPIHMIRNAMPIGSMVMSFPPPPSQQSSYATPPPSMVSGGGPMVSGGGPMGSGGMSVGSGGGPMGSGGGPMGSGGIPMVSGGNPMVSGGGPMGSGGIPMVSGGNPMVSGGGPMGSGGGPMGSGGGPMGSGGIRQSAPIGLTGGNATALRFPNFSVPPPSVSSTSLAPGTASSVPSFIYSTPPPQLAPSVSSSAHAQSNQTTGTFSRIPSMLDQRSRLGQSSSSFTNRLSSTGQQQQQQPKQNMMTIRWASPTSAQMAQMAQMSNGSSIGQCNNSTGNTPAGSRSPAFKRARYDNRSGRRSPGISEIVAIIPDEHDREREKQSEIVMVIPDDEAEFDTLEAEEESRRLSSSNITR